MWLALLDQAEAALDTIHELEAVVRSDGLLSSGSKEQVRIHPAVLELRQQRAAYARLLVQLGVDEQETQSQRQSRIARKRYQK